jgi:D-alanine-D-alanine ligase
MEIMKSITNHHAIKEKKIGVLMGGFSPEREISLKSGLAIFKALEGKGYQVVEIDVDRAIAARLQQEKIEVALIALHGPWGEDGAMQGLLEMMGIPYTGSSVLASAMAMDKEVSKKIFRYHQIPTPEFQVVTNSDSIGKVTMQLPVAVKPVCGGSTIGTSIVNSRDRLEGAVRDALQYDDRVLIEEYVAGKDLTVGVIEGDHLPVIQIVPTSGFYDFESKYTPGKTEYLIPAPLSQKICNSAQALAVASYQALSCSGAARVDFRLDQRENLTVLEINTVPGFTETSLLPKAGAEAGIDFSTLAERILMSARLHIVG